MPCLATPWPPTLLRRDLSPPRQSPRRRVRAESVERRYKRTRCNGRTSCGRTARGAGAGRVGGGARGGLF
eukprot:353245-Chlamydomonas_euryale.AAC.8